LRAATIGDNFAIGIANGGSKMYDAGNNRFVPIDAELAKKFDDPTAALTTIQKQQRDWTRFSEGETVTVKGVNFHVHEIGESRLILKPINKAEFAEKTV
jgi:hypothetical protein